MTAALLHIDRHQIWQWVQSGKPVKTTAVSLRERYKSCHVCHGLAGESLDHCATCGSPLHLRVAGSIQRTWALLITSALLYIPANTLPIMRTNFLGEETENTILGGVVVLWRSGSYPISLVIFIASVFVPIGKIIALGWLCRSVQTRSTRSRRQKTQLYRLTEFVGRWSMVDVFVVAVLVALIQLGNIMSIYPDWGALAFAGVVFFTILAALSFDPRLLWDAGAEENRR
jgi:paraquat-inducible protein A